MITTIHKIRIWLFQHFELLCWVGALVVLFFLPENKSETSLCIFSAFGFGRCPGCGIGHAMHYVMRAEWMESIKHHPLGIVAVIIIINRIRQLIIQIKLT
ncbi:MAG: DUF2752 domain-containing protein [Bacteroidota bacterium]